jgi:hypothetical protein
MPGPGLGAGSGPGRERSIRDPDRATHPDASEARRGPREQLSDLTASVQCTPHNNPVVRTGDRGFHVPILLIFDYGTGAWSVQWPSA